MCQSWLLAQVFLGTIPTVWATQAASFWDQVAALRFENEAGEKIALNRWKGTASILTMSYTNCKKICPLRTLKQLQALQEQADQAKKKIEVILVSFDPQNDTPAVLKAYRTKKKLNQTNWHFLRASEEDTRAFAQAIHIGPYWQFEEHILHDYGIIGISQAGNIVHRWKWGDQVFLSERLFERI